MQNFTKLVGATSSESFLVYLNSLYDAFSPLF